MRVIKYGVLISCLLIVCFAIWVYTSLHMSSVKEEKIFSIPPRASVQSISESLEAQGLIPNAFMFRFLVKLTGEGKKIRAGDYLLTAQSSPVDILELFVSGAMYMISVTIPEGLPWWEVATGKSPALLLTGQNESPSGKKESQKYCTGRR